MLVTMPEKSSMIPMDLYCTVQSLYCTVLYCTDLYFCFMFLLSLASCCSVSWNGSALLLLLLLDPATETAVIITGRRDITATILSTLGVYWWEYLQYLQYLEGWCGHGDHPEDSELVAGRSVTAPGHCGEARIQRRWPHWQPALHHTGRK